MGGTQDFKSLNLTETVFSTNVDVHIYGIQFVHENVNLFSNFKF